MARKDVPNWIVVAAALHRPDQGIRDLIGTLTMWTGQPRKVCLRAIQRAREQEALVGLRATVDGASLVLCTTWVKAERDMHGWQRTEFAAREAARRSGWPTDRAPDVVVARMMQDIMRRH